VDKKTEGTQQESQQSERRGNVIRGNLKRQVSETKKPQKKPRNEKQPKDDETNAQKKRKIDVNMKTGSKELKTDPEKRIVQSQKLNTVTKSGRISQPPSDFSLPHGILAKEKKNKTEKTTRNRKKTFNEVPTTTQTLKKNQLLLQQDQLPNQNQTNHLTLMEEMKLKIKKKEKVKR